MVRVRQVSLILMIALFLISLSPGVMQAQECPGTRIYFNTTTGNDTTGDGKSDATAFKTLERALQSAEACTTAVTIYKDNAPFRQISIPAPPADDRPGCLAGLATIFLVVGALAFRRQADY